MSTTICLYLRGDGATRALEVFRRALGTEADSLSIHPNRDETGYYGSADVQNVDAAREAFATARQPFPTLKAYLGILPAEREEAPPRGGQPRSSEARGRHHEPRPPSTRHTDGRAGSNGASAPRGQEKARPARPNQPEQQGEQGGRKAPLRFRNRNERRRRPDREKPADEQQG